MTQERLKAELDYFKRMRSTLINEYHFDVDGDIIKIYDEKIATREKKLKELEVGNDRNKTY